MFYETFVKGDNEIGIYIDDEYDICYVYVIRCGEKYIIEDSLKKLENWAKKDKKDLLVLQ